VAAAGASYALHRLVRSELFLLTAVALCAMTFVTTLVGRLLLSGHGDLDWFLNFFLMGGFILGEVALAVWWLRSESRLRGTEDV
jgi:ABC-type tungstate transport system substrate-binding protein